MRFVKLSLNPMFMLSTIDNALVSSRKFPTQPLGELYSDTSCNTSPVREVGPETLSRSSRALNKQYFTEITPIRVPPGHPTVALNESKISSILKAVANESARASFDKLSSVVEKASRLHLGECPHSRNHCSTSVNVIPLLGTDSEPEWPTRESSTSRGTSRVTCPRLMAVLVKILRPQGIHQV